jgi:hypothetical protein
VVEVIGCVVTSAFGVLETDDSGVDTVVAAGCGVILGAVTALSSTALGETGSLVVTPGDFNDDVDCAGDSWRFGVSIFGVVECLRAPPIFSGLGNVVSCVDGEELLDPDELDPEEPDAEVEPVADELVVDGCPFLVVLECVPEPPDDDPPEAGSAHATP